MKRGWLWMLVGVTCKGRLVSSYLESELIKMHFVSFLAATSSPHMQLQGNLCIRLIS